MIGGGQSLVPATETLLYQVSLGNTKVDLYMFCPTLSPTWQIVVLLHQPQPLEFGDIDSVDVDIRIKTLPRYSQRRTS